MEQMHIYVICFAKDFAGKLYLLCLEQFFCILKFGTSGDLLANWGVNWAIDAVLKQL